jgi:hypothetical protein
MEYEKYQRQLDFGINRVVYAIIIGALVIGASLSYGSSIGEDIPKLLGIPYFSIFCLLAASFLGFVLFINYYRSGRHRNQ